jgi:hypothetical protein
MSFSADRGCGSVIELVGWRLTEKQVNGTVVEIHDPPKVYRL